MEEFDEQHKRVLSYVGEAILKFKPCLSTPSKSFLLDLCLQIMAYDFDIRMQARADFKKNNLEGMSVQEFVKREDETYGPMKTGRVIKKVKADFLSSFESKNSEAIRNLVLDEELMRMKPSDPDGISIYKDFVKNLLPEYRSKRNIYAKEVLKKLRLSDDKTINIQEAAYKEIIKLANNKKPSTLSKNIVAVLEQCIEIYYPLFLKDLGLNSNIKSLIQFRKKIRARFNTLCYQCGKPLFKKDNKHYCVRRENRSCYITKYKEGRDSGFPLVILRTKNKCENCGKEHCSLDFIHKHKGVQRQFCSNSCWEAFRKKDYRKRLKTSNSTAI